MKSGKRHITEGMELLNQDKIRTLGETETFKYLEILEADTKHVEMKEKKFKKGIPQENEKTTQNQTTLPKSHERDKYLCCTPHKIFRTSLKVDQGRTSANGSVSKKKHMTMHKN